MRREQEAAIARIQAEAEAKARAEMRERARVAEETRLREEHEARIKAQVRRARVRDNDERRVPRHGLHREKQPIRSYNKGHMLCLCSFVSRNKKTRRSYSTRMM